MAVGLMFAGILSTVLFVKLIENVSMFLHLINIVSAWANIGEANAVTSIHKAKNLIL